MPTGVAARTKERVDGPSTRIVDAALECVSRWGLRKTTLDDVARSAGCSRATVYRQFPGGKPALFEAVAAREVMRLLLECVDHADGAESLEDFIVEAIVTTARYFTQHEALEYLLRHEPEALAPFLSFDRLEPMLVVTRGILAPSVERLCDRETAEAAIEWGVRMVLSYTFTPSHRVRLTDNGDVHRLVSTYFLPGTTVASSSANGSSPPDQAIQPSNPMFNPTAISAEPSH